MDKNKLLVKHKPSLSEEWMVACQGVLSQTEMKNLQNFEIARQNTLISETISDSRVQQIALAPCPVHLWFASTLLVCKDFTP